MRLYRFVLAEYLSIIDTLVQNFLNLPLAIGHLLRHHIPNELVVHSEIAVDEPITHPCHAAPLHSGIPRPQLVGNHLGGFAYNFQAADKGAT